MEVPELTIEVASRPEAADILASPQRCAEITCLVSIGDSHDELPAGYDNVPRKLRLLVADVVMELGATEEDIRRIIRLAEGLRSDTGRVLIHCEAGVSRSSAAALIMYACWLVLDASRTRWSGCYRSALSRSRTAGWWSWPTGYLTAEGAWWKRWLSNKAAQHTLGSLCQPLLKAHR